MSKNIEKTKTCHRKKAKTVDHDRIAEAVGASKSTVKAIRNKQRSQETDLGQRIMIAEMLFEEGDNKLLTEVKRIVHISSTK